MTRTTLITGGAASGKSTEACRLAGLCGRDVQFVATCVARDDEMRAKVRRHQEERPSYWSTQERDRDVAGALKQRHDASIVDCLTLLVSQMLVEGCGEKEILTEVGSIFEKPSHPLFVVTNEVGLGIVPGDPLSRQFREIAGRANRLAAAQADEVILMVSGLPVRIK
ncbi:MAG: bifunctional adenosylcobinamide kinase/adenosylcobinamide-phosphate guanylyltransferase [Planctomycetota bacterium]